MAKPKGNLWWAKERFKRANKKSLVSRLFPLVALAGFSLVPGVSYSSNERDSVAYSQDSSYVSDLVKPGDIYGPPTPAGYGDVYGSRTPTPEFEKKEQPKQKKSIEKMNIDSVDANYRFGLSMNRMEDTDEKRLIIVQYVLAPLLANPQQLASIEKINVDNVDELARLNNIFHDIFLSQDPDRSTYENEFITKTLTKRVRYAEGVQRKCFHYTSNRGLSVVTPVHKMLDDYGEIIMRVGYIEEVEDNERETKDVLGSSRDKAQPTSIKSIDDVIWVSFPDDELVQRKFVRGSSTHFEWVEPPNTPEAIKAMAESSSKINNEDPIPALESDDVFAYFIPVPDESRKIFKGYYNFFMNPNPFVVKSDSGRNVEFIVKTYVHGPDSNLIVPDSIKRAFPVPPGGFDKKDRFNFAFPTSIPIYRLGGDDGRFQYSAEIFTVEKNHEKWDDAGWVFIDVDNSTPVHFGYLEKENGKIQVPAVGQIGRSLMMVFPNQLVSPDRRVSLPERDSTGNYSLEYIVRAYIPPKPIKKVPGDAADKSDSTVLSFWGNSEEVFKEIVNETQRMGVVPRTYVVQELVEKRIKGRDTSYVETKIYPITDEQRSHITDYLAPSLQQKETAVFSDTLYGYVKSLTGEHRITIPLSDPVFKEGELYNFTVEVNPRNHNRFSPDFVGQKKPIPIQFGVIRDVKIVKKIPGKE